MLVPIFLLFKHLHLALFLVKKALFTKKKLICNITSCFLVSIILLFMFSCRNPIEGNLVQVLH